MSCSYLRADGAGWIDGRSRSDAGGPNGMIGAGLGAGLALVRSLAHELQDVPGAGAEHDEIDGDETQQRRGDGWGLERRGGGRGPEQAVDGERLPPAFRCYPAGNHRDE